MTLVIWISESPISRPSGASTGNSTVKPMPTQTSENSSVRRAWTGEKESIGGSAGRSARVYLTRVDAGSATHIHTIVTHSAISAGFGSPSISTVTSCRICMRPPLCGSSAFTTNRPRMRLPLFTGAMKRTLL